MNLKDYLSVTPEIQEAIDAGKPVVALESTILSHGMPYPQNVEFAHKVEEIVRAEGAVPATTAIMGGKLKSCSLCARLRVSARSAAAMWLCIWQPA